ncbi:MAG: hypothetical protein HUJ86_03895 [Synergistes sp.]|nr:hypothetical protein [Synergistes sp.]
MSVLRERVRVCSPIYRRGLRSNEGGNACILSERRRLCAASDCPALCTGSTLEAVTLLYSMPRRVGTIAADLSLGAAPPQ